MDEPIFRTVPDACNITGLKDYFIRELIYENKIKFVMCGNRYYINMASLLAYCGGDAK